MEIIETMNQGNWMNRRGFITMAGAAGLAPLAMSNTSTAAQPRAGRPAGARAGTRDYYELRQYQIQTEEQKKGMDLFLREAAIPAWNRLGIQPVGVFVPETGLSPVYVLLRHRQLRGLATLETQLLADAEYQSKGAAFLDAPAEAPAYQRVESSLLAAFSGMPEVETPVRSAGRVFQLRIYESPSVKTGLKKIEMFNTAEIAIFRKVGLHPVFFGQALAGTKMPNLTYMLAFESREEQQANWKKFGADPDWQKLRAMPEYADKKILCGITNLLLKPAEYSQI